MPSKKNSFLNKFWHMNIDKNICCNYNIIMKPIEFEWDENKNQINQRKHRISFEEAWTVFYDTEALIIDDQIILKGRNVLLFWALAIGLIFWLSVIVIVLLILRYE